MNQQKFVVAPNDVETMIADWVTAKILGGPGISGASAMSAVVLYFEPGQGHARHNHPESEQFIFVISGQGEQMVEDKDGKPIIEPLNAGSLVSIPKGAYHSTFNTGWEPMRILAVYAPPGPEQHMRGSAEFQVLPCDRVPVRASKG
jgi:oxalate decarboxylase/phosphoglucose isomerase-like protein (cupin superfamily)